MRRITLIFPDSAATSVRVTNASYELKHSQETPLTYFQFNWYDGLGAIEEIAVLNNQKPITYYQEVYATLESSSVFFLQASEPVEVDSISGRTFAISALNPPLRVRGRDVSYEGIGARNAEVYGVSLRLMQFDVRPQNGVRKIAVAAYQISEIYTQNDVCTYQPLYMDPRHSFSYDGQLFLAFTYAQYAYQFRFTVVDVDGHKREFSAAPGELDRHMEIQPFFQQNEAKLQFLRDEETIYQLQENLALQKLAVILNSLHNGRYFSSNIEEELSCLKDEELNEILFEVCGAASAGKRADMVKQEAFLRYQEELIASLEEILRRK